jgi:hypothetical protein
MRLLLLAVGALVLAGCIQAPSVPSTAPSQGAPSQAAPSPAGPSPAPAAAATASQAPAAAPMDPLHWSGTVTLDHSVYLLPWQTLRIDPGTVVRFSKLPDQADSSWIPEADAYVKDHNDPTGHTSYRSTHFMVYGQIVAVGTKEAPIRFTSASATPEYADWNQLVLTGGSRLENVTAEYMHNGINVQGDNVVLRNVVAHDALWSCIDSFGAHVTMEHIEAYHCWHQAVGFKGEAASSDTLADAFLHDSQVSAHCEDGSQPTLVRMTLRAAYLAPDCGPGVGTVRLEGGADVAGGTYGGVLVYPYQG